MIRKCFVKFKLNISKFLPLQRRKTLCSYTVAGNTLRFRGKFLYIFQTKFFSLGMPSVCPHLTTVYSTVLGILLIETSSDFKCLIFHRKRTFDPWVPFSRKTYITYSDWSKSVSSQPKLTVPWLLLSMLNILP